MENFKEVNQDKYGWEGFSEGQSGLSGSDGLETPLGQSSKGLGKKITELIRKKQVLSQFQTKLHFLPLVPFVSLSTERIDSEILCCVRDNSEDPL